MIAENTTKDTIHDCKWCLSFAQGEDCSWTCYFACILFWSYMQNMRSRHRYLPVFKKKKNLVAKCTLFISFVVLRKKCRHSPAPPWRLGWERHTFFKPRPHLCPTPWFRGDQGCLHATILPTSSSPTPEALNYCHSLTRQLYSDLTRQGHSLSPL